MASPPSVAARVRAFRPDDFEALVEIERLSQPSAWSRSQLARMLRRDALEAWVVELDGSLAGFLLLMEEDARWYLANLAIAPAFRRRGLALLALRTLDERVAARPHPQLELHVRETNLPAQLLYRKAGYRAVEIVPDFYPGETAYRMAKDLARPPAP